MKTTTAVSAPQGERAAPLQLERIDAPELLEEARRAYAERRRRRLGVLVAQRDAALSRARTACAAYEAATVDARKKQRDAAGRETEAAVACARAAALLAEASAAFEEAKAVQAQLEALAAALARGARGAAEALP